MKKKSISLILTMTMLLSLLMPGMSFAATSADAVSTMSPIYTAMAGETINNGGTNDTIAAYNAIDSADFSWAINYFKTNAANSDPIAVTDDARIAFAKALAKIKYSYNPTVLASAITNFQTISNSPESVMNNYFPSATASDLINLFITTYSGIGSFINSTDATALSTATNDNEKRIAIDTVLTKAFNNKINTATFKADLDNWGWDTSWLVAVNFEIRQTLEGDTEAAEFELLNGLARVSTTRASGIISLSIGGQTSYTFNLFGQSFNMMKLTTSAPSVLSISGNTVSALQSGNAIVYVHRSAGTPTAGVDYLYSFTVSVPSTTTGGTTTPTTTPTTPPTTTDAAVTDSQSTVTDSANVANESQASDIIDQVQNTATNLSTLVSTATTTTQQQQVLTTVQNLATALSNTSGVITSPTVASTLATTASSVLQATGGLVSGTTSTTQLVTLTSTVQSLIGTTNTAVLNMNSPSDISSVSTNIINSTASILGGLPTPTAGASGAAQTVANNAIQIRNEVATLLNNAVSAAGTVQVSGTTNVTPDLIGTALTNALDTRTQIQSALSSAGLNLGQTVSTGITLDYPTGTTTSQFTLPSPGTLFSSVDTLNIRNDLGTLRLPSTSFGSLTTPFTFSMAPQTSPLYGSYGFDLSMLTGTTPVHVLPGPLTFSMNLGDNFNYLNSGLVRVNEDGTISPVPATFNNGEVTVVRGTLSTYYVVDKAVTFSDLGSVEWARNAIETLARNGVTSGTSATTFSPNATITRGEFITMLMKIAQLNGETSSLPFTDVNAADWFATSVAAAYENNVTSGVTPTTFNPYTPVRRQDIAVMISKVMMSQGYTAGSPSDIVKFMDMAEMSPYAANAIGLVAREGIVNGNNLGEFNPQDYATRAEVAAMLYNLLNK